MYAAGEDAPPRGTPSTDLRSHPQGLPRFPFGFFLDLLKFRDGVRLDVPIDLVVAVATQPQAVADACSLFGRHAGYVAWTALSCRGDVRGLSDVGHAEWLVVWTPCWRKAHAAFSSRPPRKKVDRFLGEIVPARHCSSTPLRVRVRLFVSDHA